MPSVRPRKLICSVVFLVLASCGPDSRPSATRPADTEDTDVRQQNPEPYPEPARVPDWFDSCVPKYRDAGRREPERRQVIAVTPAAGRHIRSAAAGMDRWHVRVRLEVFRDGSGTPTGFRNRLDLDPEVYPEIDLIDDSQGVPVVVDRRSADIFGGHVLDWVEGEGGRSGLKLEKPAK